MKRNNGGYVLVYVVVVIVILCILVPAACSNSLQNLKAQQASIERMQQLYAAEGQIEQFVAEVEEQSKGLQGEGDASNAKTAFAGKVSDVASGIASDMVDSASSEEFSLKRTPDGNEKYQCEIPLVSTAGDVTIEAVVEADVGINVTYHPEEPGSGKEGWYTYEITDCTITYESYDISATTESEPEGGGT